MISGRLVNDCQNIGGLLTTLAATDSAAAALAPRRAERGAKLINSILIYFRMQEGTK